MPRLETVAVVGGGVSGLTAAAFLARRGLRVRLFEANPKVGGCCATTTLQGYTFNDGAVYLALPGLLDDVFERLGLDRASLLPLRKITANFSMNLPGGTVVTLGANHDLELTGRDVDRAGLQRELRRMIGKWQPVLRFVNEDVVTHPFSLWRLLSRGWRHLHKFRGSVASEMHRLFRDDAVRAALSAALLHSGLPPRQAPVVMILGLVAMMTEGFHLPEGGMGRIAEVLAQDLKANGGEVHLGSRVDGIIVRSGRARGVIVAGRGEVEADAVISSASGMATFLSLMDRDDVPAVMRRKAEGAPLSHRAISIQLGLSNTIEARSHYNGVFPMMEDQGEIFDQGTEAVRWPVYFVPTVTMPELAASGGSLIEMFHPTSREVPVDDRDEEIRERITASAIEALARIHPTLDVAVRRVRTPRDFRDGMHLYRGVLYGLSPAAGPTAQFPHEPPVPGLFLVGQTTYPGYGVAPSAMSGVFGAEALIRRSRHQG